jgi:hypothetical protein
MEMTIPKIRENIDLVFDTMEHLKFGAVLGLPGCVNSSVSVQHDGVELAG